MISCYSLCKRQEKGTGKEEFERRTKHERGALDNRGDQDSVRGWQLASSSVECHRGPSRMKAEKGTL